MSKRIQDSNGWIEVKDNPITKEGVFDYLGRDIGLTDERANKIVRVYRPAEELEKAVDLFKNIPLIDDHELIGKEATPAEKKGVQGWVGEQVLIDPPYVKANLRIVSDSLINKIKNGKVDLSLGYKNDYEYISGEFNGQRYDAIQRNIRPNHLALVDLGRTGKDVVVLDHYTIDSNNLGVNMTLEELKAAIAALTEEERNALKSLFVTQDEEDKETKDEAGEMTEEEKAAAESAAVVAEEAAVVAQEAADLASEAAETGDPVVAAEAETKAEEAADKAEEAAEVVTMDSMRKAIVKELNARDSLGRRAQKFVGTFNYTTMDSAQSVAEYATKKLGIKAAKGHEIVALDAWMQGRQKANEVVTMDTNTVSKDSIKSKWSN